MKGYSINSQIRPLMDNIKKVIFIDDVKMEYLIAAWIAGGHVILADSHGVGKTSLCRALAHSIDWEGLDQRLPGDDAFSRIQCTVDLLPQDIIGFTRLMPHNGEMVFQQGPIFANFVLCDEINLLTPKTQGSFFQAMEEKMVSFEGKTYTLPEPFFLISTMNLKGSHLFPLPAPQLDRFMIQLSMGYPDLQDEMEIVQKHGKVGSWEDFKPVVKMSELKSWQDQVDKVEIHQDVLEFIVKTLRSTREHPEIEVGASPRTGIKVSRLARALALVRDRDYVLIDDVKEIFPVAVAHRLILDDPEKDQKAVIEEILSRQQVKV
jgi:MoxR-like ATPase